LEEKSMGSLIINPSGIFVIISAVFAFLNEIILAILIYTDAKKRDMNATNMLLLVLFLGAIGGIIYLFIRRNYE
jgi:hypothetical protein